LTQQSKTWITQSWHRHKLNEAHKPKAGSNLSDKQNRAKQKAKYILANRTQIPGIKPTTFFLNCTYNYQLSVLCMCMYIIDCMMRIHLVSWWDGQLYLWLDQYNFCNWEIIKLLNNLTINTLIREETVFYDKTTR